MYIYVNASVGEQRDGYIELICKGKVLFGGRYSPAEREAWDKRVKMYFQKNAWMDREVMAVSARTFNDHVREKWGDNAKVLLTADNLDAHVHHGTKEILAKDGRVFILFFPPCCTEAVQPIDAGYGRSIRCCIGRLLDAWLMESDHMELWEKGMTAGERRVLISNFVAVANQEVLEKDDSRVSCFRRCGNMLTLDGSDDDLIKPQGCSKLPIKIPELIDLTLDDNINNPIDVVTPEDLEFGITDEDIAIHMGDTEDGFGDNVLMVQEADGEEDDQINLPPELPTMEEDLEFITPNDDNTEEGIETADTDENLLIQESSRGRRIIRRRRFDCDGY